MDSKTEPASEAKELKPCPFCESKAEWINETLPDGHYYIRCPNCHIVMKEDRRDKAIGMWNRREEITSLKAELSEYKERLKSQIITWNSASTEDEPCYSYKDFIKLIDKLQPTSSNNSVSEYKEVIKELLSIARSVAYNTSISTEEGRKKVREIQAVIDRAKKLIEK